MPRENKNEIDDAKEDCMRLLSPYYRRTQVRRRNRQVYNLRLAGVPWIVIARIIRRSVSTARAYHREGLKEAANADNPLQFTSARVRTRLSQAGINVNDPNVYQRVLETPVPGIAGTSVREIQQAADEQATFLEDRVNDLCFAARLKKSK